MDYSIFYRWPIEKSQPIPGDWDVFLSAYNRSERVSSVFERVTAKRKIWVIHQEYAIPETELPPKAEIFDYQGADEAEFCVELFKRIAINHESPPKICIDITGFMRPQLMCLIARIQKIGICRLDVLYTEPVSYRQRENTEFSKDVLSVRQVAGLEGVANRDTSQDLLVVGAGYDHRLIEEVAHHKEWADKVIIFGLPPLRADMYQQNLLRAHNADPALGDIGRRSRYFAPANDPFATAGVLHDIIESRGEITNLYISPLATKPQALGFMLFYVNECRGRSWSVVFPFSGKYEQRTSHGVARTWHYVVEFVT